MDIFLSYASCYGIPMIIAKSVFWAKRQKKATTTWAVSALTAIGALITLMGGGDCYFYDVDPNNFCCS
jgi:hypothetical protein